jgi:hypothetical protein
MNTLVYDAVTLEPLRYAMPREKPGAGEMIATTQEVMAIKKKRMLSIPRESVSESMWSVAWDRRKPGYDDESEFLTDDHPESPLWCWCYYRDDTGSPMRRVVNVIDYNMTGD